MTAKGKIEKIIIGTVKTIMKSRDFDVQIQPVGKNQPEVIVGTSKHGCFEMKADRTKGITIETTYGIYGQSATFDRYSDYYITALNLKHECYQYREENYHPDRNGEWVKLEKKPGFFARVFSRRSK